MIIKPGMVFKTNYGGYFQYFLGEDHDLRVLYCGVSRPPVEEFNDPLYTRVSYLHLEFPENAIGKLWYKSCIESKRWKAITRAHYRFSRLQFATNVAETSAEMQSKNEDFSVETTD